MWLEIFEGESFHETINEDDFTDTTLWIRTLDGTCVMGCEYERFVEKAFTNGPKFTIDFSLENFPRYASLSSE